MFGNCRTCILAHRNYDIFRKLVARINQAKAETLPLTVTAFVKSFDCGYADFRRHTCESNECDQCTLFAFFTQDPKCKSQLKNPTTFSNRYGIEWILEEQLEYWLFLDKPQTLSGKRKYDMAVLAKVTATVGEFLVDFQRQLIKFRPHVAVRVHQNRMLKNLRMKPAAYLDPKSAFCTADFSQNGVFREALRGTQKQFMEKREFSIENFLQWTLKNGDPDKLEETHQHYVCEDPKHDVSNFYLDLF